MSNNEAPSFCNQAAVISHWLHEAGQLEDGVSSLYLDLIKEEYEELIDANLDDDKPNTLKEGIDTIWTVYGFLLVKGYTVEQINKGFAAVANSNFSKFPPTFNEMGKLMKSPNYKKPDMKAITG